MILIALTPEQADFVRASMDSAISFHTKMAFDLGADMRTWKKANAHAEKEALARGVFEVLDAPPPVPVLSRLVPMLSRLVPMGMMR